MYSPVIEMVNEALSERIFSGAGLIVMKEGSTVIEHYFGTVGLTSSQPVGNDTFFDLASLTKVLATTPCWLKLVEGNNSLLDSPLKKWIPQAPPDKKDITPRLLLAHSSGLPAWRPYYLFDKGSDHQAFVIRAILNEHLDYPVASGSLYSDLGFMLLGHVLEGLEKDRLDQMCLNLVYGPLTLGDELVFSPTVGNLSVAETRSGEKPGLVNDLNARALRGISGHAGLFGTCRGVAQLTSHFLTSLKKPGGFFDHSMMKLFVTPCHYVPDSSRALGFDTKSGQGSSCGSLFSSSSFGHTGFTGTSLWVDPVRELVCVFLTNRVVMGEPDLRIKDFRPKLHDSIAGVGF